MSKSYYKRFKCNHLLPHFATYVNIPNDIWLSATCFLCVRSCLLSLPFHAELNPACSRAMPEPGMTCFTFASTINAYFGIRRADVIPCGFETFKIQETTHVMWKLWRSLVATAHYCLFVTSYACASSPIFHDMLQAICSKILFVDPAKCHTLNSCNAQVCLTHITSPYHLSNSSSKVCLPIMFPRTKPPQDKEIHSEARPNAREAENYIWISNVWEEMCQIHATQWKHQYTFTGVDMMLTHMSS